MGFFHFALREIDFKWNQKTALQCCQIVINTSHQQPVFYSMQLFTCTFKIHVKYDLYPI